MNNIVYLLLPFIITYTLIFLSLKKFTFINFLDAPGQRKKHINNIPAIGGIMIVLSLFILSGIYIVCDNSSITDLFSINDFNIIFICSMFVFLLGVVDDIYQINVFFKLFFQIIICFIAISMIEFINVFSWPFIVDIEYKSISFILSLVFMLIIINGCNFLDGLDGLLSSQSIIVLISFIILYDNHLVSTLITLIGSLLAFFLFNKFPAKIFLGDSGSLFIGWIFTLLSFNYATNISINETMLLPLLILSLQIIDVFYVAIIRFKVSQKYIYSKFRNVFVADRNHLHYKLLDKTKSVNLTIVYLSIINFLILVTIIIINN